MSLEAVRVGIEIVANRSALRSATIALRPRRSDRRISVDRATIGDYL